MSGGSYGHHQHHSPAGMFSVNAYGQPMATFIPPNVPMYQPGNQPGSSEMLPASVQLRLDQLTGTGFCSPGEIDDRYVDQVHDGRACLPCGRYSRVQLSPRERTLGGG